MNTKFVELVMKYLKDAIDSRMYGSITFTFQNGIFTGVKIEKTEKPPVDVRAN